MKWTRCVVQNIEKHLPTNLEFLTYSSSLKPFVQCINLSSPFCFSFFQSTVAPSSSPTSSSPPPSSTRASNTSTTAVTSTPAAPRSTSPGSRCCDTGRPIFTDPISGQTICSCQYDLLNYQRLAAGGGPGLPLSMYSAPYPEGMAAYFPALGADQAPFYSSAVSHTRFYFMNYRHTYQTFLPCTRQAIFPPAVTRILSQAILTISYMTVLPIRSTRQDRIQ